MTTHALRYNSSALNHVVIIFVSRRMYDNCGTLHLPLLVKEVPFYTKNVIRKPGRLLVNKNGQLRYTQRVKCQEQNNGVLYLAEKCIP
ncbi:hypothetical protein EMCRGX_G003239 [Ephydatia muelleri]